ncbi:MAG: hypothetical protein LAP85_11720 [Acidobacteriia bacterium]|nr:hypothetical protein [Terriglobia bacterium]
MSIVPYEAPAVQSWSLGDPVNCGKPYSHAEAVPRIPQRRVNVSPRVDYQLNSKNTLTVRYSFSRTDIRDSGLGSFNLASRGYHSESRNQTLQFTETALLVWEISPRIPAFRASNSRWRASSATCSAGHRSEP